MNKDKPLFGKDQAENYDERWSKLAPVNNGLHFLSRIILSELPADSDILCVGVGTGAELLFLAQEFPGWSFTALDTSAEMLEVCRKKSEDAGISARCRFHQGTVNSLPSDIKYDAATAILVSQFMPETDERIEFFREILKRLNPKGYFINADLTSPDEENSYAELAEVWAKMLMMTGLDLETAKQSTSQWGKMVAVSKQKEIESMIASAGFNSPTLFYQSLFIRAWFAKTPDAA